MAFTDNKITTADLNGKGVVGLPDAPQLSAENMQKKFDEIATDVIVPKFNALCDEMDEVIPPITLPEEPADGDMLVYDANSGTFIFAQKATAIALLKDVDLTGLDNGMFLRYDYATRKWKPTSSTTTVPSLDDINDVSINSPQADDLFIYDAENQVWINGTVKIDKLSNVYIHLPSAGDYLMYDAVNDRWYNGKPSVVIHTKVVQITTSGWSEVTVNSRTLQKLSISVTDVYDVPCVSVCNSDGTPVTTDAYEKDFMLLEDVGYDADAKKVYLYASRVPANSYYVSISGVE